MKRISRLLLVAVLGMAVVACGDDGSGGDATIPTGTDGSGVGDVTIPTGVGNIPGVSSECEAYANLSLAMSSAFTGGFGGFSGDLVSQLPAAGRADGAIIVAALQEFSGGLAAAGIDLSQGNIGTLTQDQLQVFSDLSDSVFTDEVNDAFDRLSEVVEAECALGG